MISFKTVLQKFGDKGEKTGWTYIEVPAKTAGVLKQNNKKSFRVKGKLDNFKIEAVALLPMGGGSFIMPLNATIRKGIGKRHGAMLIVQLSEDEIGFIFNVDFMDCLNDEPAAVLFFKSLTGSHQRYFSKWIDDAKTIPTRTKRIAMAITALAKKWGYPEMIRNGKRT